MGDATSVSHELMLLTSSAPMTSYLFVHQNFPGQFPHIAGALAERGDTVVAIGDAKRLKQRSMPHPRIQVFGYPEPEGAHKETHHYLRDLEAHTRRGQAVFRLAQTLLHKGFKPDVVVAHPGWGEAIFLKDAFPHARHIQYLEFFYRAVGADVGFDAEFPATVDSICKVRIKNSTQMLSFEYADAGISPTRWQKSRYPADWQPRITQLHDGINTSAVCPADDASVTIIRSTGDSLILTRADEVLTYVARNLEPYRGFHSFMRAIPAILEQRPSVNILVVGADGVSYGRRPPENTNYRQHYLQEWGTGVDQSRVHFLGTLPYAEYVKVLQISSLHVYLTYPFVLSWSMLEAMSAGCVVLASNTDPVREVIQHGENGFLTDFFDHQALASAASDLLANRKDLDSIRLAARETILEKYDLHKLCLPQMLLFLSR
jgi:glycosyltransferase involved in cell wall biosynthesis